MFISVSILSICMRKKCHNNSNHSEIRIFITIKTGLIHGRYFSLNHNLKKKCTSILHNIEDRFLFWKHILTGLSSTKSTWKFALMLNNEPMQQVSNSYWWIIHASEKHQFYSTLLFVVTNLYFYKNIDQ